MHVGVSLSEGSGAGQMPRLLNYPTYSQPLRLKTV